MVKWGLILFLVLLSRFGFGQLHMSQDDCKIFIQECVDPLIDKNVTKLDSCIQFPLAGDWGYIMGLFVEDFEWNRNDFYENFEKLFTEEFIGELKELDCSDIEIYQGVDYLEYVIGIPSSDNSEFESATLLRYRKMKNTWVLVTIQVVG